MIPRLFVDMPLAARASAPLSADQAHYLRDVLRREVGAPLLLFNGVDGEFSAVLEEIAKKRASARIEAQTRPQSAAPDLVLAFAPVKRQAVDAIVQKGVELGVSGFMPVITARTNSERVRTDRLASIAREAAEQSGRLCVPDVDDPVKLARFLEAFEPKRPLIFCDEAGDDPTAEWGGPNGRAQPMLKALQASALEGKPMSATILIGPEGGFTSEERSKLRALPNVLPVTLGPRILRADTAAFSAIALWQSICGDWTGPNGPAAGHDIGAQ
ncbi:MAG: 16S rRNA (uracil(1498)-N(3))-methyltransferase [Pseudomonadota bacterium]